MTQILNAKPIVEQDISQISENVAQLISNGIRPKMCVILVGNNPSSLIYIRNKKKLCEKVGAEFDLIHLGEETTEHELRSEINSINCNSNINGVFVQLPLPKSLSHVDPTVLISPIKDVDGLHPNNFSQTYRNLKNENTLIPCTPKGILRIFDYYNVSLQSKNVCVLGRSLIVGRPMSQILLNKNATVTHCHSRTINLQSITKNADIIISAVGSPRFLTKDFFRDDKSQTVVDVGITKTEDGLAGDCDFHNIKNQLHSITPVPGGVGPMTVLSLMKNLVIATKLQHQDQTCN